MNVKVGDFVLVERFVNRCVCARFEKNTIVRVDDVSRNADQTLGVQGWPDGCRVYAPARRFREIPQDQQELAKEKFNKANSARYASF